MNASPQNRCKCSEIICNVGQFLTLLVSICTLVLLLLMIFLVTGPNDDHYAGHSELLPPRPDVAIWLQQISGQWFFNLLINLPFWTVFRSRAFIQK